MRIVTKIEGNLRLNMEQEIRVGKMAALGAAVGVAAAIKMDWRQQIAAAGLGRRLGNTIRSETYPKNLGSLNAAALVWSNAKKIVGAFETGVEIRAKNSRFLAFPLKSAGLKQIGKRITPDEWERRKGRRLKFVRTSRGGFLLIDDGTPLRGPSTFGRGGPKRGFKNRSVAIFVLAPRVRLQKRLGLYTAADRLARSMGARLVAGWRD